MYSAYTAGIERSRPLVWVLIGLLVWQTTARAEEAPGAALPEMLPQAFPAGVSLIGVGGWRGMGPMAGAVFPTGEPLRSGRQKRADREPEKRLAPRLLLSAGAALACGAAAWWSREKADRAYATYMRSASRQRQEKQFDRAERYDRIAGTAFIGMEAGLVLTTFLLFF